MKQILFTLLLCCFSFLSFSQDNSNMLLGNPSKATAIKDSLKNYLYDQKYFIESYNAIKGEPNWVSWHLDSTNIGKPAIRLNNFRYDYLIPYGWYQVLPRDYTKSGFDLGHNCPSDDRSISKEQNSATFVVSNMIPQAPRNNRILWAHFEEWIREQITTRHLEAYVIMGSYGIGGTGSKGYQTHIGNGKVVVPSRIWKIVVFLPVGDHDLLRINGQTEVICIDSPNDNNLDTEWKDDQVRVVDIEKATGYHFFTSLNANVACDLKTQKIVIN